MPSADEIRDAQRATWARLSASWEKWDSVIMGQLGPVGAAMIERLDIAEDQQHLDIAAGTGEPGLSIARLSPKGRVVLTDLSAEMLDVAARRARAQGVANIETKVCSADDLHSTTPHSIAFRVFWVHVLPDWPSDGRVVACSSRADVSARRYGSSPRKTRGRRSPCRQSRPRRWWRHPTRMDRTCFGALPRYVVLVRERLLDVAEWEVDIELVTRSPEQYWEMISDHVSLAVAALQKVDESARERIRANAIAKVSAFEKDGKVRVPGVARCIVGTKQDASGTRPRDGARSTNAS